jgi:hypothetical protein
MSEFQRTFGNATSPLALSYLDDNFGQLETASTATATISGAGLIGYLEEGANAVADNVRGMFRRLPFVNITSFMTASERTALLAGTQVDATTALTRAKTTGRPVWGPYGNYEISSPVTVGVNICFQGADTNQSTFILTGTGQLVTGDTDLQWTGGFKIKTAVNSLTMVKVAHSRFNGDFSVEATGGATGVTGVEWAVGTGLYHSRWTPAECRAVAVANRVTGANPFNNNVIGHGNTNWITGTDFLRIENTGVNQVNTTLGYVESFTNVVTTAAGAGTVSENDFNVWADGHTNVVNANENVGENTWTRVKPGDWVESLAVGKTVARQIFSKRISCRVFLETSDQTINDNTETKISFNSESWDDGACYTASPNFRWQAKRSGRVRVFAQAAISGNLASADQVNLSIYKNGALYAQGRSFLAGASIRPVVSDIVEVVKDDYIEIFALANEAAGANTHTIAASSVGVTYATFEEI